MPGVSSSVRDGATVRLILDRSVKMMRPTRKRILSAALAGAGFVDFNLAPLPAMAEGSIVVRNFVLSHGIHEREPISDTESFNIEDG